MERMDAKDPPQYAVPDSQMVPGCDGFLVLARGRGEDIVIEVGDTIILVRLVRIGDAKSRIGIMANYDRAKVNRREVWDRIHHPKQTETVST